MKIVFIGAIWCPSCLLMKSRIRKLMIDFPDITLVEYDIDSDIKECEPYAVGKILPLVVLESESGETSRFEGEKSRKDLVCFIEGYR